MDLLTLGKEPIKPDQPAGADARYDPAYEELQAEVDKPPSASGGTDWAKVVKISSEILSQKSKDLLVASYLALGLIQTKKFEGFEIGCRIIRDLVENHWDALFPAKARMRGRIAAIEWWVEKTESVLEPLPKGPFAEARIAALRDDVDTIDRLLAEYIEESPSIRPLLDFVGSLEAVAPPPPPKAPEAKAAPGPVRAPEGTLGTLGAEQAAAPVAEGPVEISSPETAQSVLEKAMGEIARVADYYREEGLANPMTYHLARTAAWAFVEALPPSENGRTQIPPPYTAETLRDLVENGQDEALVRTAEQNLGENIFWLDLQFRVSGALSRMGEEYAGAASAVRQETALLVQRFPGIQELSFADGTPFASEETRAWLKDLSAAGGAGDGGVPAAAADPTAKELGKARELLADGKLPEAVRRLQQRMRGSVSRREALLWRVSLCRLLIGTPEARHVVPLAEEILGDIGFFNLEEYDPEFALKALKVAWEGFQANAGVVPEGKLSEIRGRIAKIDVSAAMSLIGD